MMRCRDTIVVMSACACQVQIWQTYEAGTLELEITCLWDLGGQSEFSSTVTSYRDIPIKANQYIRDLYFLLAIFVHQACLVCALELRGYHRRN
jgi:hypothetical protein